MPNDKSLPEQETAAQQETGGDCVSRLVGRLVFAGDLEINGEEISGCALDIDRPTLIAARSLPMYEECVILTAEELREMKTMVESLTRDLWTVIEVARRNMSKKHGTIERIAVNLPANAELTHPETNP